MAVALAPSIVAVPLDLLGIGISGPSGGLLAWGPKPTPEWIPRASAIVQTVCLLLVLLVRLSLLLQLLLLFCLLMVLLMVLMLLLLLLPQHAAAFHKVVSIRSLAGLVLFLGGSWSQTFGSLESGSRSPREMTTNGRPPTSALGGHISRGLNFEKPIYGCRRQGCTRTSQDPFRLWLCGGRRWHGERDGGTSLRHWCIALSSLFHSCLSFVDFFDHFPKRFNLGLWTTSSLVLPQRLPQTSRVSFCNGANSQILGSTSLVRGGKSLLKHSCIDPNSVSRYDGSAKGLCVSSR
mmetsp:Transcript_88977/g.185928  ORF Transcript_88977/g.185928 Transcript_88977/m.185928 type:complete len:292 (-) Transcript_88977:1407-2282(-)